MARNYYTLVAGLREFAFDSEKKGFDALAIKEDIRSQLSDADKKALDLFYGYYDIENIINAKAGRAQFSVLGNYDREQIEEQLRNPNLLPQYIAGVLAAYANPEDPEFDNIDRDKSIEKALFEAYYTICEQSTNSFIRDWYEFDRNLRNTLAAYAARKAGIPAQDAVVGQGYVVDTLSRSSAADFGLKGELDYIDEVMSAMGEEGNLLEKERRIDLIRWRVADELTTFDYFNLNAILSYLVKVNIVHRWVSLDENYGREMFNKLIASLSSRELITAAENKG